MSDHGHGGLLLASWNQEHFFLQLSGLGLPIELCLFDRVGRKSRFSGSEAIVSFGKQASREKLHRRANHAVV